MPPVDVITGGSPCQDLSVAGKRKGLLHADLGDEQATRSGLFMEQVRIVKEMRAHDRSVGRTTEFCRPRFMVWENVPGAFSSNGGEDFQIVLEEIVRIAEPAFTLPGLPPKQKWTKSGLIIGDSWSVAWRTHDAQYWGVPQRRRRISLVADFGGQCAGEILFEPRSVSGDFAESGAQGERPAGTVEAGTSYTVRIRGGCDGGGKGALVQNEKSGTNQVPAILDMSYANDVIRECGEVVPSLQARMGTGGNQVPLTYQIQGFGDYREGKVASSCKQRDYKDSTDLVYAVDYRNFTENSNVNGALQAKKSGGSSLNLNNVCRQSGTVRRLTPLECTRLQGFPDGWVDIGEWTDEKGRVHKEADAPKYKALGNSIALPFWYWMFCRMAKYLPENATLGSLFDGIGGFPLCWEAIHGKGTARWASEIEEFPIAVTKIRFSEVDDDERKKRA